MSQAETSVAERNRMIDLKLDGCTLQQIAEHTGWSYECVRKWWRQFRSGGRKALKGGHRGKPGSGVLSSFPGVIRFALLRVKKMHPGWGAPVAQLRVAQRLNLEIESMPCVSSIEKYWAQFPGRLSVRYAKRHPPPKVKPPDKPTEPHQRWQADFKERVRVKGMHTVDVLNIRDEATPVNIGSFVYPAGKCTGRDMQQAFRRAFQRWGLCDRVKTDRDKRVRSNRHSHPFPTLFVLWLVGLGIAHDLASSAPDNGCTERSHRTWYERVVVGRTFPGLEALQQVCDEELALMNSQLPSKGRACAGRPPLVAYPQALQPRRPYTPERELDLFSLQRVYDFLSTQVWWRKVSVSGQIMLGDQRYGIGMEWKGQEVRITFDANQAVFIIEDAQEQFIKSLSPKNLSVADIIGIELAVC